MLTSNQQKWVAALRSGKYPQCFNRRLCSFNGHFSYCALGVAYELMAEEGLLIKIHSGDFLYYNCVKRSGVPSDEVRDWLGLTTMRGSFTNPHHDFYSILALNDEAYLPFTEIADFIESEPAGLFL